MRVEWQPFVPTSIRMAANRAQCLHQLRRLSLSGHEIALTYDGNENPSNVSVSSGLQAVVDAQFERVALSLSEGLNLNTALTEHQDAWLCRLLRESVPLVHEVEKLVSVLAAEP
ncbi:hypothetical protein ACFW9I_22115 [[Kitasatospora] papulosa]|uniref:hypothetical protein n=1 Tax=[Kitasatospora] papulosa TaxID=1464011 RepID=UPI00368398BD